MIFLDLKPTVATQHVKKQYTARDKADCKAKKARERKVKKEGWVALPRQVKHTVWEEAHKGVDQKVFDRRKCDNECTPCGMENQAWKHC